MEKKEKIDHVRIGKIISLKKDYIKNLFNARYFIGRCNMMQDQLVPGGKIIEDIDGCIKSRELMLGEYGLMRMQAIDSTRNSNFAKKELIDTYSISQDEIDEIEKRYYEGKIIDEKEDENYKIPKKADFVKEE